jgi:replicative DNA helicase
VLAAAGDGQLRVVDTLLEFLDRSRTGGLAGVSTRLRDLDTLALGLSPGLYLLAASTGTAMAGQIALHVAEHHGPVVFVSMQLTDVDLGVRLVSVLTNIKKERLVVGGLTAEQHEQVHGAVERMSRSRLYMVYGSGYTTGDVRAHLLRAQAAEAPCPGSAAGRGNGRAGRDEPG